MPVDLDALSREVAAAGDEWMVPGVEAIRHVDSTRLRLIYKRESGAWTGICADGVSGTIWSVPSWRPNLRDPVTVNALLGNGQAWRRIIGGGLVWVASVDLVHERTEDLRTTAICRAWIAARGKR